MAHRSHSNAAACSAPFATAWRAAGETTHHGPARRKAGKHAARVEELLSRVEGFLRSGLTSDRDFQAMVGRWIDHWDRHNWVAMRQYGAVGEAARPRPAGKDGVRLAREARAYLRARRLLLDDWQRFLHTLP
jgi:hypothetical protein